MVFGVFSLLSSTPGTDAMKLTVLHAEHIALKAKMALFFVGVLLKTDHHF
jgi:hypothetical protein